MHDDTIPLPRETHRVGYDALQGAAIVLRHMRDSIAEAIPELLRHERELLERDAPQAASVVAGIVACLRAVGVDTLTRRAALLEFARDFRACDPELTPVRSPSQSAIQAFKSSQEWSDRAAQTLKAPKP